MSSSETDDVVCKVVDETDKAYQLETDGGYREWFPKSQISFKRRNVKTGEAVAEIPLWLLTAKGWD